MAKSTCSVPGCGRKHYGKGYCCAHYQRVVKFGDPRPDIPLKGRRPTRGTCSIDGCTRPHYALGWCASHHQRWQKTGEVRPEEPIEDRVPTEGECTVDDCGRPRSARGLCIGHLRREDNYGDVMAWLPIKETRTDCSVPGCDQVHAGLGWCEFHYQPWRLYRVTPERFDAMMTRQGGGCAICGRKPEPGTRLHIDHDHRCCPTKKWSCGKCVRGLLCAHCNNGLGRFRDDPDRLRAAADYLGRTSFAAPESRDRRKRNTVPGQLDLWGDEAA